MSFSRRLALLLIAVALPILSVPGEELEHGGDTGVWILPSMRPLNADNAHRIFNRPNSTARARHIARDFRRSLGFRMPPGVAGATGSMIAWPSGVTTPVPVGSGTGWVLGTDLSTAFSAGATEMRVIFSSPTHGVALVKLLLRPDFTAEIFLY